MILRPATRRLKRLERAAGPLAHPVFAVVLYVGGHVGLARPRPLRRRARHPAVHALEHTAFMSAGVLYWWHLLSPIRTRYRLSGMGPVVYMLSTKLLVGLLGIALTFAPDPIYAFYEDQPRIWGLSASDDQAIAGAVMALEQSIVMGIALAWLFVRALAESEAEEQRAERYAALQQESPRAMPTAGDGGAMHVPNPDGRCTTANRPGSRHPRSRPAPRSSRARARRRPARSVTSPRTASRSHSTSDGAPAGKRSSKSPISL